jgi:hypothetical protein
MKFTSGLFAAIGMLASASALADSPGPTLNPYRAYPPSCLALPFPAVAGPTTTARVTVDTVNEFFQIVGTETVSYIFWRTPCSGGPAALLGEVVRDQALQGTLPVPIFPLVLGTQGSAVDVPIRLAAEPNTIVSFLVPGGTPVLREQLFVFENTVNLTQLDFSASISLTINGTQPVSGTIPAFDPNQYANAFLPMQISGYQTGNYADPTAGDQGVQVEVAESPIAGQRTIVFAWYTYDSSGIPYWLFNSASVNVGDRSVSMQLGYFGGGGFVSGNGSAALWGNITVSFPDCNHMNVTYGSAAGLPNSTPQGSGTRTFSRITSINGTTCD